MENRISDQLWDVKIPMRDGVKLSADIYFPPEQFKPPYPVIIRRTPYNNADLWSKMAGKMLSSLGYVFVTQDVRGRGDSEGTRAHPPCFPKGPGETGPLIEIGWSVAVALTPGRMEKKSRR